MAHSRLAASAPPESTVAALNDLAAGSVGVRALDRLAYAHDASHFLLTPSAVVTAVDAAHVSRLLGSTRELGIDLSFRSGGTSLSGQASTDAVMVDTRKNFRSIDVLDSGARVRVQPGATVRQVNARLARFGTKLGPDPASEAACTIGGIVANNSSGMACGVEFNTYNTIESAVLVLASGTILDTAAPDSDERLRMLEPTLYAGLAELRDRVVSNAASVRAIRQQFSLKNTMGYGINAFVDFSRPVDILLHLVVGSEGTLAFVAEATFRTIPVKKQVATGMMYFESLALATGSLPLLSECGFATIELMDATSLRVAQRDRSAGAELAGLDVREHAAFLVEFQEETAPKLEAKRAAWLERSTSLPLARDMTLSEDPAVRNTLWHIRKDLYATVAGARPSGTTALLEDVAVPVDRLLATCTGLEELFRRHSYEESVIFGHAKDGNIHFMINERFDEKASLARYLDFTDGLVDLVLGEGGTLKAEHGTGRMMAPFVSRQYGVELFDIMLGVKRLFDPAGALNPGVLIDVAPNSHVHNMKTSPEIEAEADKCVECGYCEPVCPSKDLTTTPRQRIVLRRELERARQLGDDALVAELSGEYSYDAVDTCAADGMCGTVCPVLIDTGSLMKRFRGERPATLVSRAWDLTATAWGPFTTLGGVALTVAGVAPAPVVSATTAIARRLIGDDVVPQWSRDLPRGGKPRRPRAAVQPVAVFVPSCIGALFGAGDGSTGASDAFLTLSDRAGITVKVPEGVGDLCCGTPWKSKGYGTGYESMRRTVLAELLDATEGGRLPVVCDASSCTEGYLKLVREHPALTVIDSVEFVDRYILPKLTILNPLESLAVHPTCSSTQLGLNDALMRLARAVAHEAVVPLDWGCCGFAGDRGMLHPELTASATEREAAEVAGGGYSAYASLNRTCELGMTRATGENYLHILELLERVSR